MTNADNHDNDDYLTETRRSNSDEQILREQGKGSACGSLAIGQVHLKGNSGMSSLLSTWKHLTRYFLLLTSISELESVKPVQFGRDVP